MAYGDDFGYGPADLRRAMARYRAPRPSWDVPEEGIARPAASAGVQPSTGDQLTDVMRDTTMADAAARSRGARFSAQSAAPNDPSLAAYAGLEGLLSGQGDAARALNRGALERLQQLDARQWQEYIMRLQRQWAEEDAGKLGWAELLSGVGDLAGNVGGAWLSPGGIWAGSGGRR